MSKTRQLRKNILPRNMMNYCNIQVLTGHMVGIVGGQFYIPKDQRFVGVYQFETACGSLTCCLLDGQTVYFEAEKIKVTAWRQPKMSSPIVVLGRGTSLRQYRKYAPKFSKVYLTNPFTQEIAKLGEVNFKGKELVHVVSKGTDCRLPQKLYDLFREVTITANVALANALIIKYPNFQPMPPQMQMRGFPLVGWNDVMLVLRNRIASRIETNALNAARRRMLEDEGDHAAIIGQLNAGFSDVIAANNARATTSIRCWPTTGLYAIELALIQESPDEIYLFGFDCFTHGDDSYFIGKRKSRQPKDAQEVMRYYLKHLVKEFATTTFYSADDLPDMDAPNWKVLKNDAS